MDLHITRLQQNCESRIQTGLSALAAAKNHADVLIIEKEPLWGGTSATSGAGIWIPASDQAAAAGFHHVGGVQKKVLAEATGDELHADRRRAVDAGRTGDAGQADAIEAVLPALHAQQHLHRGVAALVGLRNGMRWETIQDAIIGGIAVVYAIGIPVMAANLKVDLLTATTYVTPFLTGDFIKVALTTLIAFGLFRAYPKAFKN